MNHGKKWISYQEAQSLVDSLKIRTHSDYNSWVAANKNKLPSDPVNVYKNKGWTNWFNFIGMTEEEHRKKWNSRERTYTINENYFKTWSHNMAYILGLWWADGCMTNKYRISITLHGDDKYLLEQVSKEMGINKPLYIHKNVSAHTLDMASTEIVKDIVLLGGKPNKSKNMNMPINLPKEFVADFIRGLWDGDGGLWSSKTNGYVMYLGEITSGDKTFLEDIKKLLQQNIKDIGAFIVEKHLRNKNKHYINYGLRFSINSLRRLRDFMYINDPEIKMLRKYNLMQKLGPVKEAGCSFEDGRKISRTLNILTPRKWQEYIAQNPTHSLPVRPDRVYKNKGWINWGDWLGRK